MKFIAKEGCHFKPNTECKLLIDYGNESGDFSGIRIAEFQNEADSHNVKIGEEYFDTNELCDFNEFVVEFEDNLNAIRY